MTILLVASTGGHLKQLHRLRPRFVGASGPSHWVTFDTPQSRSLLAGENVDYVRFVGGRDPVNAFANSPAAWRLLRSGSVEAIVSTGSAVALPFFGLGRARRLNCHYIESAARTAGPSLTGKLISRIPGVELYCQYPHWAQGRWVFRGSVFDSFKRADIVRPGGRLSKVVVTLGTYRGYGFANLIRQLLKVLPDDSEVLWQTGDTDTSEFDIQAYQAVPESELAQAMREADVVIAHAGVGSALVAMEAGKCPVLVPRRFALGEHVDDHQIQIARELAERGLATHVATEEITQNILMEASRFEVQPVAREAPFNL